MDLLNKIQHALVHDCGRCSCIRAVVSVPSEESRVNEMLCNLCVYIYILHIVFFFVSDEWFYNCLKQDKGTHVKATDCFKTRRTHARASNPMTTPISAPSVMMIVIPAEETELYIHDLNPLNYLYQTHSKTC